jgi:putative Tad-like protein involved in Flp pilus assembly
MSASGTTAKSLSLGRAGFSLVLVGLGVFVLYQYVATTVDVQMIAATQSEAQSLANAAAAGSVLDLPKGSIAVIRTADQIIAAKTKANPGLRSADPEIEIGHWDAASRSFSVGAASPNAVRTKIRVRTQPGLLGNFVGGEHQIEAQAVAVIKSGSNSLVAESPMTAGTRR